MPLIIRRKAYQQEFNSGSKFEHRECTLLFIDIDLLTDRNQSTLMQIWSQCVSGNHTERHVVCQTPDLSGGWEGRFIVRQTLKMNTTLSTNNDQKIRMLAKQPVFSAAKTFAAACTVSTATIIATSLDNAAQREAATLVHRTTKLDTGVAQCSHF